MTDNQFERTWNREVRNYFKDYHTFVGVTEGYQKNQSQDNNLQTTNKHRTYLIQSKNVNHLTAVCSK